MLCVDAETGNEGPRHLAAVGPSENETDGAGLARRIGRVDAGVPALAGFAAAGPSAEPVQIRSFGEYAELFGDADCGPFVPGAMLPHAVWGFFANGGHACWVQRIAGEPGAGRVDARWLTRLLEAPATVFAVPDAHGLSAGLVAATELQRRLSAAADEDQHRMVLLDPPAGIGPDEVILWRRRLGLDSPAAVIYYPWLEVSGTRRGDAVSVPPSGHVLGSWTRVGDSGGVHRAPIGQPLSSVDGLATTLSPQDQRGLSREGINCLRAFPGPEPRIWGARTLSSDPDWRHLHRRRTYSNLLLSIAHGTGWVAAEPLDDTLLERLRAAVTAFLQAAWRGGWLQGASPGQAFFVRCAPAEAETGEVALELGLALRTPAEYRVARLVMRTASAS